MKAQYKEIHYTPELFALRETLELLLEAKFNGDRKAMYYHLIDLAEDDEVAEAFEIGMALTNH